jgi:hypothetical protein
VEFYVQDMKPMIVDAKLTGARVDWVDIVTPMIEILLFTRKHSDRCRRAFDLGFSNNARRARYRDADVTILVYRKQHIVPTFPDSSW